MDNEFHPNKADKKTSGVTIGSVIGGIYNSIIAGRDVIIQIFTGGPDQQRALRNRQALLKKVHNFWVEDVLENSLHGAALIELGLEERLDAVDNRPWDLVLQTPDRENRLLSPGTKIIDVFDEMEQSLLILGEPGSGKTTMLLELARDTIARAEKDPIYPIPAVFNLSSWTNTRQPIAEWLVDELNTKYNIPKKMGRPWVENDDLLLLLDGLDEVNLEDREACVKAINEFRQEHLMPLVVCSRIADYEGLATQLKLQGAVLLQPLTLEQIEEYLTGDGVELLTVRRTLQSDPILQELAQSPLMLSIMILAYQSESIPELQPLTKIEARRKHLFDAYVRAMFKRRGTERLYSQSQTIHWLAWLAQKMSQHTQTVFLIERMQPSWLSTHVQQWLYVSVTQLLVGLVTGLVVILSYRLIDELISKLFIELMDKIRGGLIVGLVVMLIVALIVVLMVMLIGGLIGRLLRGREDLIITQVSKQSWLTIKALGTRLRSSKPQLVTRESSSLDMLLYRESYCITRQAITFKLIIELTIFLITILIVALIGGLSGDLEVRLVDVHIQGEFGLAILSSEGLTSVLIGGVEDIAPLEILHWSQKKVIEGSIGNLTGILSIELIIGLIMGLIVVLSAGLSDKTQIKVLKWSRIEVRQGLIAMLTGGLIIVLIASLSDRLISELILMLISGLIIMLSSGRIIELIGGLEGIPPIEVLKWSQKKARKGLIGILVIGLSVGLIIGGIIMLSGGLVFGVTLVLIGELAIVLIGGLFMVLFVGRIVGLEEIAPIEVLKWSQKRARKGLIIGSISGLLVGLIIGLIGVQVAGWRGGQIGGLSTGLFVGLVTGLTVGVTFGLVLGLRAGLNIIESETKMIPNQGIRQSAKTAAIGILIGGVFGGLIGGLIEGPDSILNVGVSTGLIVGLFYGGVPVIQHLTLRSILYYDNTVPWHYARFLDYAAERIFLRKVGGGYIFIHRLLMEYFAELKTEE